MDRRDAVLLERWAQSGDAEAFRELVKRYAGMVYATAHRILGNPAAAEDIAQDAFLSLAKGSRVDRSLGPWLHRVATNKSLDALKADARRKQRESAWTMSRDTAVTPEWNEIREYLDEAINALPERQRGVIIGHFLNAKTHEELAQTLGITRSAVTHRIAKGVEQIRGTLKKRGVPVASAALTSLLTANAVEAAPAKLITALSEIALVGPIAAPPHPARLPCAAGGIAPMQKALALLIVLVAAVGAFWYLMREDQEPAGSELAGLEPTAASQTFLSTNSGDPLAEAPRPAEEVAVLVEAEPDVAKIETANQLEGLVYDAASREGVQGIPVYYARVPADPLVQIVYEVETTPSLTLVVAHEAEIPEGIEVTQKRDASYTNNDGQQVESLYATLKLTQIGESDSAGRFVVEELAPGDYAIVAGIANNYRPIKYERVQIASDKSFSVDIVLTKAAGLRGLVTQAGVPVADSQLRIDAYPSAGWRTVTDADGQYNLEGIEPVEGLFRGFLNLPNGVTLASRMTRLQLQGGQITNHNFEFSGGSASLKGKIYRQSDGSPLTGHYFVDWQFLFEDENTTDRDSLRAQIEPDGTFSLGDFQDGPAIVSVFPRGVDGTLRFVDLVELTPGTESTVDFPVWDTAINFEVANMPADAVIQAVFAVEGEYYIPRKLKSFKEQTEIEAYMVAVAFIENGKAKISGLPPGQYTVVASALPTGYHYAEIVAMGPEFFERAQRVLKVIEVTEDVPNVTVNLDFNEQ